MKVIDVKSMVKIVVMMMFVCVLFVVLRLCRLLSLFLWLLLRRLKVGVIVLMIVWFCVSCLRLC